MLSLIKILIFDNCLALFSCKIWAHFWQYHSVHFDFVCLNITFEYARVHLVCRIYTFLLHSDVLAYFFPSPLDMYWSIASFVGAGWLCATAAYKVLCSGPHGHGWSEGLWTAICKRDPVYGTISSYEIQKWSQILLIFQFWIFFQI